MRVYNMGSAKFVEISGWVFWQGLRILGFVISECIQYTVRESCIFISSQWNNVIDQYSTPHLFSKPGSINLVS